MTRVVEHVYAIAALALIGGLAAPLLVVVLARARDRRAAARAASSMAEVALPAAAVVASAATAGSLYFSEVAGFVPCELCWYQRTLMYPLVPLLVLAALRRERRIAPYALVLALAGVGLAAYHYQLEWFPEGAPVCTIGVPCTVVWFRLYGFVSLPFLSLVGFGAIAVLAATLLQADRARARRR